MSGSRYFFTLLLKSLVLFTVTNATVLAQTPVTVFTLDFPLRETSGFTTTGTALGKLKKGDYYIVKITNINTLNYKVVIGNKDTLRSSALNVPTFGGLGLADLTSLAAALTALGGINAPATADTQMKTISNTISDPIFSPPPAPSTVAERIVSSYYATLTRQARTLRTLNTEINARLISTNADVWSAKLDATPTPPAALTSSSLRDFLIAIGGFQTRANTLESSATSAYDAYIRDSQAHNTEIQGNATLKDNDAKVKAAYQKLAEAIAKIKAAISVDGIRTLSESIIAAVNNTPRTYTSVPLLFSKEQTTLKISIVPQPNVSPAQTYATSLVFPLTHRAFWGVSSGFYLSGLHNDAYSTKAVQPDPAKAATYQVVAESPGSYEFGVSALVRYGFMLNPDDELPVGLQLGFGPALAVTNKVRPRLMLGGGLALGTAQKLLIDGGVNFGYVDRLSQAYSTDMTYYSQPGSLMVSAIDHSWFVGLHYLFFKF